MSSKISVELLPTTRHERSLWRLLKDYKSGNQKVTVPAGFVTDGASVPRPFRWLLPSTGAYFGAAVVHDYIIEYENDWPKANSEFNAELKALEVKTWQRVVLTAGVLIYYWALRLTGSAH